MMNGPFVQLGHNKLLLGEVASVRSYYGEVTVNLKCGDQLSFRKDKHGYEQAVALYEAIAVIDPEAEAKLAATVEEPDPGEPPPFSITITPTQDVYTGLIGVDKDLDSSRLFEVLLDVTNVTSNPVKAEFPDFAQQIIDADSLGVILDDDEEFLIFGDVPTSTPNPGFPPTHAAAAEKGGKP